jgi:serine/threonine protein kinase
MEGKFYDYSSDIWSIGMAVYEMATGVHPYPETTNVLELYECIKTSPSPKLAGFTNLSAEIVDFVSRW